MLNILGSFLIITKPHTHTRTSACIDWAMTTVQTLTCIYTYIFHVLRKRLLSSWFYCLYFYFVAVRPLFLSATLSIWVARLKLPDALLPLPPIFLLECWDEWHSTKLSTWIRKNKLLSSCLCIRCSALLSHPPASGLTFFTERSCLFRKR